MAASYPTTTKSFTTKTYGDLIQESHINDLQDEVMAIEDDLRAGLPIARGGTGATNSVNAATNLGVLPLVGGTLTGTVTGTKMVASADIVIGVDKSSSKIDIGGFGHYIGRNTTDGALYIGGGQDSIQLLNSCNISGSITASSINATTVYSNLSGTTITASTVTSTNIRVNTITCSNIAATKLTCTNITATAITASDKISSAYLYVSSDVTVSGAVTATTFYGNLTSSIITATNIAATSITATGTVSALNMLINSNQVWHVGNPGTTGSILVSTGTVSTYAEVDNKNYVIDGNFQIAQVNPVVGTEITNPASLSYPVFDLWKLYYEVDGGTLPTTIKHSQQLITSGSIHKSTFCYRVDVNGAGSGFGNNSVYQIYQLVENGVRNLCGLNKKITITFWAKTSISGTKKLGIGMGQLYGTGGSPSSNEWDITGTTVTLTSNWTKYAYTFTTNTLVGKTFGTNNDDYIQLQFGLQWGTTNIFGGAAAESFVGSGTIEIADVNLFSGDIALPSNHGTFDEELIKCQRYYEKSYSYSVVPGTADLNGASLGYTYADNNDFAAAGIKFMVTKRANPVMKIYNPATGTENKVRLNVGTEINSNPHTNSGTSGLTDLTYSGAYSTKGTLISHWTADIRF